MKLFLSRFVLAMIAAVFTWLLVASATPAKTTILAPDKFIVASTTDVKGKTSPCG